MINTTPAKAGLDSLPEELLANISLQLDYPSSLALALTAHRYTRPAEHRLWNELRLVLPFEHVHDALQAPHAHPRAADDSKWDKNLLAAEKKDRARIKAKVRSVLLSADRRKWGLVRSAELQQSQGSGAMMLSALEMVAPKLESLVIRASETEIEDRQSLEIQSLDLDIHFPSLTYVQLGAEAIQLPHLIPLLCNAAPGLTVFDLDMHEDLLLLQEKQDRLPRSPEFVRPTNIRDLRIKYCVICDDVDDSLRQSATFFDLLENCPRVKKLALIYFENDLVSTETSGRIIRALASYSELEELQWGEPRTGCYRDLYEGYQREKGEPALPIYPALRSLTIRGDWKDAFAYFPPCPKLEGITLMSLPPEITTYSGRSNPALSTPLSMTPAFAGSLRASPQLRSILSAHNSVGPDALCHLTDEDYVDFAVRITSITHEGAELLHVRHLSRLCPVRDSPTYTADGRRVALFGVDYKMHYDDIHGMPRIRCFEGRKKRSWYDYTEFEGMVVPLEVVAEVKRVEGGDEGEWDARGVEVGTEAWEVLLRWQEGMLEDPEMRRVKEAYDQGVKSD